LKREKGRKRQGWDARTIEQHGRGILTYDVVQTLIAADFWQSNI
jgi:hypothetical protein